MRVLILYIAQRIDPLKRNVTVESRHVTTIATPINWKYCMVVLRRCIKWEKYKINVRKKFCARNNKNKYLQNENTISGIFNSNSIGQSNSIQEEGCLSKTDRSLETV